MSFWLARGDFWDETWKMRILNNDLGDLLVFSRSMLWPILLQ